jgi:hypothetical protein
MAVRGLLVARNFGHAGFPVVFIGEFIRLVRVLVAPGFPGDIRMRRRPEWILNRLSRYPVTAMT